MESARAGVRPRTVRRLLSRSNPQRTSDKVGLIGIIPLVLRLTILDEAFQAAVCTRRVRRGIVGGERNVIVDDDGGSLITSVSPNWS